MNRSIDWLEGYLFAALEFNNDEKILWAINFILEKINSGADAKEIYSILNASLEYDNETFGIVFLKKLYKNFCRKDIKK